MFEWLFNYPRELFEQGTLVFAPWFGGFPLLWGLVVGLVAVLLGSALFGRRVRDLTPSRRLLLGGLQLGFVALVLVLLARPLLEITSLTPGANSIAVLLDASESMGLPAEAGTGSRFEQASGAIEDTLLPALGGLGRVATFAFGSHAEQRELGGLAPDRPASRLLASLEEVLAGFRGAPLAAVVVLSDGADNDAAPPELSALASAGVPVHTVALGPTALPGEVEIADVSLPAEATPNTRVVAQVTVRHDGAGEAMLRVRDGARLLAAEPIRLAAGTTSVRQALSFDSGPGGIRELVFEIDAPATDGLEQNNRLERLLAVADRRRRILYLEGEPRWEYKFLRRALAGDDVLTLTSWLRTTERKTYRQDVADPDELAGGFPDSLAALYGYDVIVLGSLAATYLDDEAHGRLERFIADRGGSLLALAGREALADGGWDVKPLAQALPVRLERVAGGSYRPTRARVRLTRDGAGSPATQLLDAEGGDPWSTLPALGDYQRLGALKPAASSLLEVLLDGERQPLLVVQPYGLGTSAVLATATTWRWRMGTASTDERHTLFWRQLLRQLAESARQPRSLAVEVGGDRIDIRLTERDETFLPRADVRASARVTGPTGDSRTLPLTAGGSEGVFGARLEPGVAGVYRIDVGVDDAAETMTRFVRLGGVNPEFRQPVRNGVLLARIAAATGGRAWALDEVAQIAPALRFAAAGVTQRERLPLWNMPAAFLLALLLKAAEWLLRRRWGRI